MSVKRIEARFCMPPGIYSRETHAEAHLPNRDSKGRQTFWLILPQGSEGVQGMELTLIEDDDE